MNLYNWKKTILSSCAEKNKSIFLIYIKRCWHYMCKFDECRLTVLKYSFNPYYFTV